MFIDRTLTKQMPGSWTFQTWSEIALTTTHKGICAGLAYAIGKFMSFLIWLAWKPWSFFMAVLGPKVSKEDHAIRMGICDSCEHNKDGYCGECGCPKWSLSRLTVKNWMKWFNCPKGSHPGSIALPLLNAKPVAAGGCTNCGDKA